MSERPLAVARCPLRVARCALPVADEFLTLATVRRLIKVIASSCTRVARSNGQRSVPPRPGHSWCYMDNGSNHVGLMHLAMANDN